MSGHAPHHRHPGYSAEQVLCDGCTECEARSRDLPSALGHMDFPTFARAWRRAEIADKSGLPDAAAVEMPLLEALAAVQRHIESSGWPALLDAVLNPA